MGKVKKSGKGSRRCTPRSFSSSTYASLGPLDAVCAADAVGEGQSFFPPQRRAVVLQAEET
jgi:hypothetical protein